MVSDLSAQGDNAAMFVQEEHVAVTPHELQDQYALDRFARSLCQMKLHHPFESDLVQLHQSELPEAVLQLLGQGAAAAAARRSLDLHKAGSIGLPAEFKPDHPFQAAEAQLDRARVRLLGFLEPAWHDPLTQVPEHRSKGGEVHLLEADWDGHREHRMGRRSFLLC